MKMRSEGSRSNYLKIEHVMTVWNLIHAPAVTTILALELIERGPPAHFDFYLELCFGTTCWTTFLLSKIYFGPNKLDLLVLSPPPICENKVWKVFPQNTINAICAPL